MSTRLESCNDRMISVIVPVYNTEQYLTRCLESILLQTYKGFECIIVDDGSTDRSLSICKDYEKRDPRFRVFHKNNGGVSSARNYGLRNAKGGFIYFVDSDDELFDDTLEYLISKMNPEIDLVFGGFESINSDGKVDYTTTGGHDFIVNPKAAMDVVAIPKKYYYTLGMPWLCLYRKCNIDNASLKFDERYSIAEERLFLVSYIARCKNNIRFTTRPIYKYYLRETSVMNSRHKVFQEKSLKTIDLYMEILKEVTAFGKSKSMIFQTKLAIFTTYQDLCNYVKEFNHPELCQVLYNKMTSSLSSYDLFVLGCRERIKKLVCLLKLK